jgi:tetratricopeptide (TPR) repeat protein
MGGGCARVLRHLPDMRSHGRNRSVDYLAGLGYRTKGLINRFLGPRVNVDRLRPLWDFDDLDGTEARLREQFEREETDAGRAEALTQLARVEGLRDNFDSCARLLAEAEQLADEDPVANVRLKLERGRMLRSSGDPAAAFPLFESAYARALEANETFLAGDAAHMCAIATDDRELQEEWTCLGLEHGHPSWAGSLYNNLGWAYADAGDHERALELFELALEARLRDPENQQAIEWAREAVAEAKQALGRV